MMSNILKRIVLCKGLSDKHDTQEIYVKTLESAGYTCICLPTLRFEFINLEQLRSCLSSPEIYLGLILTSPRSVDALNLATLGNRDLLQPWHDLPAYCIGPTTTLGAQRDLNLLNCRGSECGNSKDLADRICQDLNKDSKPLLYPCSEIARDTLEQILVSKGNKVEKLITYKTLPSITLENDLLDIGNLQLNVYVFFSPSTVEYIVPLFEKYSIDLNAVRAIAIGPVTGKAITQAGLITCGVAREPTPLALLQTINNAILQN